MHDQPSVAELVQAVKNFIDDTAGPNLSGHAAFHAKVASNTLATILRDLEGRSSSEARELEGLNALLGTSEREDLSALNRKLSAQIQSGTMTIATPGLLDHLKQTTIAQVEIDQPRYSGLKTVKARNHARD